MSESVTKPRRSGGVVAFGCFLFTCVLVCGCLMLLPFLFIMFLLQGIVASRLLLLEGVGLLAAFVVAIGYLVRYQIRYAKRLSTEEGPPSAYVPASPDKGWRVRDRIGLRSAWILFGVVTGLAAAVSISGVQAFAGILVLAVFGPLSVMENRRGLVWMTVELLLTLLLFLGTWTVVIWLSIRKGTAAEARVGTEGAVSVDREWAGLRRASARSAVAIAFVATLVLIHFWNTDRSWKREQAAIEAKDPPYRIASVTCQRVEEDLVVDVATSGVDRGAYEMEIAVATPSPTFVLGRAHPVVAIDSMRAPVWRAVFHQAELDSTYRASALGRAMQDSAALEVTATLSKLNSGGRVRSSVVSTGKTRLFLHEGRR